MWKPHLVDEECKSRTNNTRLCLSLAVILLLTKVTWSLYPSVKAFNIISDEHMFKTFFNLCEMTIFYVKMREIGFFLLLTMYIIKIYRILLIQSKLVGILFNSIFSHNRGIVSGKLGLFGEDVLFFRVVYIIIISQNSSIFLT